VIRFRRLPGRPRVLRELASRWARVMSDGVPRREAGAGPIGPNDKARTTIPATSEVSRLDEPVRTAGGRISIVVQGCRKADAGRAYRNRRPRVALDEANKVLDQEGRNDGNSHNCPSRSPRAHP